jgi:hypothetical protein
MLSENNISYLIRGASFKIYNTLGPGLLESVYEHALAYELRKEGCNVKTQVPLPVIYEDIFLELGLLINFNTSDISKSIIRIVNNL